MNTLALRNDLETLLVDYLGEYTLGNGIKTPAVSVRAAGESLPAKTTVNGLELVVLRNPALEPISAYNNAEAFRVWTVFLVDWAQQDILQQAVGLVVRDYPSTRVQRVTVPEGLGPQEQVRLEIRLGPDRIYGLGES